MRTVFWYTISDEVAEVGVAEVGVAEVTHLDH